MLQIGRPKNKQTVPITRMVMLGLQFSLHLRISHSKVNCLVVLTLFSELLFSLDDQFQKEMK